MKLFFALLVCLLSLGIITKPAYAHVLKTDGTIGAVFHINPEDDPIAGTPSDFFFEFKDKENKFKPEDCDCTVTITESGKEIFSQPLFQNTANPHLTNASFSFTFPQKDVYKVVVSGKPLTASAFQPFALDYDLRVARESNTSGQTGSSGTSWLSGHIIHLVGAFIILGIFLFALIKQSREKSSVSR